MGPEGTTALRVSFSAIILLLIWRPWRFPLTRRDFKAISLYGGTLGLMNLCFYLAIKTVPLGLAIAIEFIGPLTLALCSSRRKMDIVWVGFAAFGLLLLIPLNSTGMKALDPAGVGFALASALCWALYIIFGKHAGKGHAGQVTSLGLLAASLVVLPFGVWRAGPNLLKPSLAVLGFAVAVLSSAIPYSLEMYALKRLPHYTFGVLLSLEPAVGAAAGFCILGEVLAPIQWIAICSVIVASIGSTLSSNTGESAAEAEESVELLPP